MFAWLTDTFASAPAGRTGPLALALRQSAEGGAALLMDPRDTSFVGVGAALPDEEVISAVKAIPTHYAS